MGTRQPRTCSLLAHQTLQTQSLAIVQCFLQNVLINWVKWFESQVGGSIFGGSAEATGGIVYSTARRCNLRILRGPKELERDLMICQSAAWKRKENGLTCQKYIKIPDGINFQGYLEPKSCLQCSTGLLVRPVACGLGFCRFQGYRDVALLTHRTVRQEG